MCITDVYFIFKCIMMMGVIGLMWVELFMGFQDYVYVYDGIPSFMSSSSSSSAMLLASYCGYGLTEPISVEAKTGSLTVYFEGNIEQSK